MKTRRIYDSTIEIKDGVKIGMVTIVVAKHYKQKGNREWNAKCICDCGNICFFLWHTLRTTNNTIKNCGCRFFKNSTKRKIYYLINGYKNNAKEKNIPWELSDDFAAQLLNSNCFYCGIEPYKRAKKYHGAIATGIDRLDNRFGYTITNSVSCCQFCNYAKRNLNMEDFLRNIKRIYEYLNLEESSNLMRIAS